MTAEAEGLVPLKIFVRPERRFVAEGRPTELIVLVRLVPSAPDEVRQTPLNLAVMLDCSTSMAGARLEAAKRGVHKVIDMLGPDDRLAVVTSGDFVDAAIPSTPVTDREALKRAVSAIGTDGVGALYPSWFGAAWEAAHQYDRRRLNRVIVVSDGMARLGATDASDVHQKARGLFRRGVSTSIIGVGAEFKEDEMLPLAVRGGGNASYVIDPEELVQRLEDEVIGARSLFSEWATMRFDLDSAEVVDVLNGFDWVAADKVSLPPLYGASPLNVVIRLRLRPGRAGAEMVPLTVRVKSLDLMAKQAVVHRKRMKLHVVAADLADGMGPDLGVQAQAARLEFARMHRKCIERIDVGDLAGARQLLDFSLGRFQSLAGQSGGTLLTEDLAEMTRMRQRLMADTEGAANRKFFRFSALFAQRAGISRPTPAV